jgi:hypothetical protein
MGHGLLYILEDTPRVAAGMCCFFYSTTQIKPSYLQKFNQQRRDDADQRSNSDDNCLVVKDPSDNMVNHVKI